MRRNRFVLDSADELLILTTEIGKPLGFATRRECHEGKGKTHWGLLAIIKRPDGRIILARRSSNKSVFPNIWDGTVATHVLSGDTPEIAAQRETKEELGLEVSYQRIGDFFYSAQDRNYSENEFCSILIGVSDKTVNPNTDEVSEVKELNLGQLKETLSLSPREFSPWFKTAFKKFQKNIFS